MQKKRISKEKKEETSLNGTDVNENADSHGPPMPSEKEAYRSSFRLPSFMRKSSIDKKNAALESAMEGVQISDAGSDFSSFPEDESYGVGPRDNSDSKRV